MGARTALALDYESGRRGLEVADGSSAHGGPIIMVNLRRPAVGCGGGGGLLVF